MFVLHFQSRPLAVAYARTAHLPAPRPHTPTHDVYTVGVTADHWPKSISLSAKGVDVAERYCAARGAKQRPTRLRNTVIGVLARTTHMRKSVLQRQCETCLALLACEAVKRVRNPRLRGEAAAQRPPARESGERTQRQRKAGQISVHEKARDTGSSTPSDRVEQFRVPQF